MARWTTTLAARPYRGGTLNGEGHAWEGAGLWIKKGDVARWPDGF